MHGMKKRTGLHTLLAVVVTTGCATPQHEGAAMLEKDARLGTQVELKGTARDAKAGAVIVSDAGEPVYVRGLTSWPTELHGSPVAVVGTLQRRKLIPDPSVAADGAVSAGAEGEQLVLMGASEWKRGIGRLTVVTGVARNAGAGPVIVTPIGPAYVHAAGERWPAGTEGKSVTGVGDLLRKKRPATPDNDDSEFGGRPELTEEWALDHASWVVE
jgi:hypothetical protein